MNPAHMHPNPYDASYISSGQISVPLEVLPPPPNAPEPTILEILRQNQQTIQILNTTIKSLTHTQPSTSLPQQVSPTNRDSLTEALIDIKNMPKLKSVVTKSASDEARHQNETKGPQYNRFRLVRVPIKIKKLMEKAPICRCTLLHKYLIKKLSHYTQRILDCALG